MILILAYTDIVSLILCLCYKRHNISTGGRETGRGRRGWGQVGIGREGGRPGRGKGNLEGAREQGSKEREGVTWEWGGL